MSTSHGSLSPLEIQLLLALSSPSNLIISLSKRTDVSHLTSFIADFCNHPAIHRSVHACLPSLTAHQRYQLSRDEVFDSIFLDQKTRELPQVLILPGAEDYLNSVQNGLHEALRDGRFILNRESYNLPAGFVLIGIVESFEGVTKHLIDQFGLSFSLPSFSRSQPVSPSLPPVIPFKPLLYTAPPLRTYVSDLLSATRHFPLLQNHLITYRCSNKHIIHIASLYVKLRNYSHNQQTGYPDTGEIRPQDVKEVFGSCVLHRLRAREEHEMLERFWKPLAQTVEKDGKEQRGLPSVEAILEHILDSV